MTKEYFAYNYIAKIAFIERANKPKTSLNGEFFETWADAYALITKQAIERLRMARKQVTDAERHLRNVENMKRPKDS